MASASDLCPICYRYKSSSNLHLHTTHEDTLRENSIREVSLPSIYTAALSCKICSFIKDLLTLDATTPTDKDEDGGFSNAVVRVDDDGLRVRFTEQWFAALVTEIYMASDDPTHQPKLPIPIDIHPQMSCDIAAGIINRWMRSCEEHTECKLHNFFTTTSQAREMIQDLDEGNRDGEDEDPSFPKRLISINSGATSLRLVQSNTLHPYPPYLALSYCWGPPANITIKTTPQTLTRFSTSGIPLEELPQTIKDAVFLTKKIGLDYLWVDAICIVQGDQADWERESRKMGFVYSNAKIVLSATRSSSVEEGIFLSRSPAQQPLLSEDVEDRAGSGLRARRNLNHEIITSCRTKSDRWWERNINSTFPLLSRGWGFQERMLATRIVHFTPSELVWECQRSRKCECRVVESNIYPAMNNIGSALRVCLELMESGGTDRRSMRMMWREIVNSYSVRRLTRIEDKLPALSGIASLLGGRSGDTYVAGLWERAMPFDLLWRCDQSGALKSRKTRKPSWSWISVDGAVKWPISQYQTEEQPLKYVLSTTYFEGGADGVDDSCEIEIELDGEDKFGRVKAGKIKIKTRLESVVIIPISDDETWKSTYGTEWAVQVRDGDLAPFWPDTSEEGWQLGNVAGSLLVMEVMKPRTESGSWEEALVVRLRCGSEYEYERVGVAANVSPTLGEWKTVKSWFETPGSKEITLV